MKGAQSLRDALAKNVQPDLNFYALVLNKCTRKLVILTASSALECFDPKSVAPYLTMEGRLRNVRNPGAAMLKLLY